MTVAVYEEKLKRIGGLLRPDSDSVAVGLQQLREVFQGDSDVSVLSLHQRRVCLFLVNVISVLPVVGSPAGDPTVADDFIAVFTELIAHLNRLDVAMSEELVSEAVQVLGVVAELWGSPCPCTIEVFAGFVSLIKRAFSGTDDGGRRGVMWPFASPAHAQSCSVLLCGIFRSLVDLEVGCVSRPHADALIQLLCNQQASEATDSLLHRLLPLAGSSARRRGFVFLNRAPVLDEEDKRGSWTGTDMVQVGDCALIPSSGSRAPSELDVVGDDTFEATLRLARTAKELSELGSIFRASDEAGKTHPLLRQLLVEAYGPRGVQSSGRAADTVRAALAGTSMTKSLSSLLWLSGMTGKTVEEVAHGEGIPDSVSLRRFLQGSGAFSDAALVRRGLLESAECGSARPLEILAQFVLSPRSVEELLVEFLAECLAVYFLLVDLNGELALKTRQILVESIGAGKNEFYTFIEGAGGKLVVEILRLLEAAGLRSGDQATRKFQLVVECLPAGSIRESVGGGGKRRRKVVLELCEEDAEIEDRINGYLATHYLHVLQILEEEELAKSGSCCGVLELFLRCAGRKTVTQYAAKTLEVLIKAFRDRAEIWKSFCDTLDKALSQAYLPAALIHAGALFVLPTSLPGGLVQVLGADAGESKEVLEFVISEMSMEEGERPVSVKVALFSLLTTFLKRIRAQVLLTQHVEQMAEVARLAMELLALNAADAECARVVSAIMGEIGCFSRDFGVFETADKQALSAAKSEGVRDIATAVLTEFAIPKLKLDAYALCAQEILAHFGGKTLLEELSSETARILLRPYLHSKYRFAGSLPEQSGSQGGSAVVTSLDWIFDHLPQTSPFRNLLTCTRLAYYEDKSLAVFLLPFAFEAFSLVESSRELVDQARLKLLGPSSLMTSQDGLAVSAGVKVLDHLQRSQVTPVTQQILHDLPLTVIVRACIRSQDWSRALFFSELLYWQKGAKPMKPLELKSLGEVYAGLQDEFGLQGVLALSNQSIENVSQALESSALELSGDFVQLAGKLESADAHSLARALIKCGKYHTALQLASLGPASIALCVEAAWKCHDWSKLGELVAETSPATDDGFGRRFGCLLAELRQNGKLETETVSSLRLWLAKKFVSVRSAETVANMHILEDVVWLSQISGNSKQRVAGILLRRAERAPAEVRVEILEAVAAAVRALNLDSQADELDTGLLRACRKSGRAELAKQFLLSSRVPRRLPRSCGSSLVWERTKQVSKVLFALNEVEAARALIDENKSSGSDDSWVAELTALRWSCRLNLLIPRAAVLEWRELLRRAQSRPLAKEKEKVSFYFAEYLDAILVEVSEKKVSHECFDSKTLAMETVRQYLQCLQFDLENKRTLLTLSRVIQIYAETQLIGSPDLVKGVEDVITAEYKKISPWIWLAGIQQLVARAVDKDGKEYGLIMDLLVYVVDTCQDHAGWYVVPGLFSKNEKRRQVFGKILQRAKLVNLHEMKTVVEALLAVAKFQKTVGDKPTPMQRLSETREGTRLLASQSAKSSARLVLPVQRMIGYEAAFRNAKLTPLEIARNSVYIQKWEDPVMELSSKARPKRLSLVDSEGVVHYFLAKSESRVDIRKDARIMELANVINKEIFAKSPEAARRNLYIKTYSVVPLSENSALIEWVNDLAPIRPIVWEGLKAKGCDLSRLSGRTITDALQGPNGHEELKKLHVSFPPVFHEWFSVQFQHPEIWLRARRQFVHSLALWSMFGFVIGLGDRHLENMLVDLNSGQVVHVDFDCILRQGLHLQTPEVVPFRLTQNLLAVLGPTGVEGTFRKTCELVMALLRKHRMLIMGVLAVFTAEPLMEEHSKGSSPSAMLSRIQTNIKIIDRKLQGGIDASPHPPVGQTEDPLLSFSERDPRAALGRERGKGLSVEAQVDELIKAATCLKNLSKMYLGWAPML